MRLKKDVKDYKIYSILSTIDIEILKEIVKISNTISDILYFFELKNVGHNYTILKKRIAKDNINISHIKMRQQK